MRWALAFHPDQIQTLPDGRKRLRVAPLQIAEHCIPAARGQGWVVLGSDSELLTEPIPARTMNMDLLSGPRRRPDHEDRR